MTIRFPKQPIALALVIAATLSCGLLGSRVLSAQSLTVGGLTTTIVDERGAPVAEALVTLERPGGSARSFTADRNGMVTVGVLTPGRYSVLAEQFGYQPVRMRDVAVVGGGMTRVSIKLTHRPPPITTVEEQTSNATVTAGAASGRVVTGREITDLDRRHDVTGVGEVFSEADVPRDGRQGLSASGNGLRPGLSSLVVDGVPETLLRHPGLPGDPASAPLFARDGVQQVAFAGFAADGEWPSVLGTTLSAQTTRGTERFSFLPWATFSSAKLGGRSVDNPGDSAGTSIQAGLAMGGSINGDTASWSIRGDYQQLQQPTANPFDAGRTTSDTLADLNSAIGSAAQTLAHQGIGSWLAPTVRTWKGGSGSGRLDWRFGATTVLALRAGGASWTEDNPQAGTEMVSGAGSQLKAHDISGAVALTTGGDMWTSETRVGVRTAERDWTSPALPFTALVADALAIGGASTLAGTFKETGLVVSEAVTYRAGSHSLKGGVNVERRTVNYDWLPGGAGRYEFGDLASFVADRGSFYQATRATPSPDLGVTDAGFFAQDNWQATAQVQLFAGVRYDHEALPTGVIAPNQAWGLASGIGNTVIPVDTKGSALGPRGGFVWDASGSGRTVFHGEFGIVPGRFDLAALAEAAQYDGDVTVRRAVGSLQWPQIGNGAGTVAGPSLTFFDANIQKPRAYKSELSFVQQLAGGTVFTVTGAYRHTDYLLRREDLNRVPGSVATAADGRPIFGSLQNFGGLIVPLVGSNRRFNQFDMAYGLTSSGYADYYEATLSLEHRMSRGLTALINYTYSRTTDDLPGQLSGDPADQLSPFPGGLNGVVWENGRSDLDIPHRIAATLQYTSAAKSPITLSARYRFRSGLPFTPGYRPGVDVNGDGSGNNDPAFIGATMPGMSAVAAATPCLAAQMNQIAARNSCREAGVHSLDLHAGIPLPFGSAHAVVMMLDGFNIVGTATGLVDRAAALVDPRGSITIDASGHTVLPLIANPGFGQLMSVRGNPRQIRLGFRVEN